MRRGAAVLTGRAAELRDAFDRRFAEPPSPPPGPREDMLTLRVGLTAYAVRLEEISGLYADRTITTLPSLVPEFLGLAGFRGTVVPVYDLATLLGENESGSHRWLVLTTGQAVVAFAFDEMTGHLRVPRRPTPTGPESRRGSRHARQVLRVGDAMWPVLEIPSLLEAISGVDRDTRQKER